LTRTDPPLADDDSPAGLSILVMTIVHRPEDARILHRQIASLRTAGWAVTYAAPFSATGTPRPAGLATIDLPRAAGRDRTQAVRTARRVLRAQGPRHDVVLLHDPELLLILPGLDLPCVVWDVHEDTAAAVSMKAWMPDPLRRPSAWGVRAAERWAERQVHLILAEDGYVDRFPRPHPVVPNSTWVPTQVSEPGPDRAVYVGALTRARGAFDLIETGRLLTGSGVTLHVIGHADAETEGPLSQAHASGAITWHGFLPNDEALAMVDGATAGLSLLHDEANYRHSKPTKVIEYMSHGVPVVTTPTPPARALVEDAGCGVVVPFQDPTAAADAVLLLAGDAGRRRALGRAGHEASLRDHDWRRDGARFVAQLRDWARSTS
jgi:glycosyltransferase involved in cell wall biosynthesis